MTITMLMNILMIMMMILVPLKSLPVINKRAVFDVIPSTQSDTPGSACQCDSGSFLCITDKHLMCRDTLASIMEEELQVLEKMQMKSRRKKRRHLKKLFRKW